MLRANGDIEAHFSPLSGSSEVSPGENSEARAIQGGDSDESRDEITPIRA